MKRIINYRARKVPNNKLEKRKTPRDQRCNEEQSLEMAKTLPTPQFSLGRAQFTFNNVIQRIKVYLCLHGVAEEEEDTIKNLKNDAGRTGK